MTAVAADAISYEDLYARWERGNWRATEIDFAEDRRQWQEVFTPFEREAALWNYSLFFWGEDAVAGPLAPFVDPARARSSPTSWPRSRSTRRGTPSSSNGSCTRWPGSAPGTCPPGSRPSARGSRGASGRSSASST